MKVNDIISSFLIEAVQEIRFAGWIIRYSDEQKNGTYNAIAFLTIQNKVTDQIKASANSIELVLNDLKTQIKQRSNTVATDTGKNAKYKTVKRDYDIYAVTTIDFNKAASELIGFEHTSGRLIKIDDEIYFDLMYPEIYKEFEGDVQSLGFKNIIPRIKTYLAMSYTPKQIHALGLELGGRYILDLAESDNPEYYKRYSLTLHSIQQATKEKLYISDPAFIIAVTPGKK